MIDHFLGTLTGPCSVKDGDSVLVCCSGGIDSMVLLELMRRAAPVLNLRLGVVHVEHGLRGKASASDAGFVLDTCRRLSLKSYLYELRMNPDSPNLEEEARKRRYEAIHGCMKEFGFRVAATGHTMHDQAETILYRIIRGSGIRGLAGMDYTTEGGIIRPLLDMKQEDIHSFAVKNRIPYVEDSSNTDTNRARNLIRHEILPRMKKINPGTVESIFRLSGIARQEGSVVDALVKHLQEQACTLDWGIIRAYKRDCLVKAHDAVLRRFIIDVAASMLDEPRGIDSLQVDSLLSVLRGERRAHTLKRKLRVSVDEDMVIFRHAGRGPYYQIHIPSPGTYSLEPVRQAVRIRSLPDASERTVLRSALPGDRIQGKKVFEVLRSAGVSTSLRHFWPVLLSGDTILAVAGMNDRVADSPFEVVLT